MPFTSNYNVEELKNIDLEELNELKTDVYEIPNSDDVLVSFNDMVTTGEDKREFELLDIGKYKVIQNDYVQKFLKRHGIPTSYVEKISDSRIICNKDIYVGYESVNKNELIHSTQSFSRRKLFGSTSSNFSRCRAIALDGFELLLEGIKRVGQALNCYAELIEYKVNFGYVNITPDGQHKEIAMVNPLTLETMSLEIIKNGVKLAPECDLDRNTNHYKAATYDRFKQATEVLSGLDNITL